MKNKRFWVGILVITLVFGMTVSGCVKAQTDTRLNGTWKYDDDGAIEKDNFGNYEVSNADGTPVCQGTYTTRENKITSTPTYYFGTELGLDARWYSKDEVGKEFLEYFETGTAEYVINGNKITYTYDGETSTATLISSDGKFTKATSSSKKSVPVEKSSGSVSSFPGRWSLVEGPTRNNPEEMDLLKDGTGIVDGAGISWKIENGRFYLIHPLMAFSSIYNVSGSTLTLTKDDGVVLKYKKK